MSLRVSLRVSLAPNAPRSHRLCSKCSARPTSVCAVTVCAPYTTGRYAPQAAMHAPSTKPISGESNIVEMLLQPPALLQHATATGADRNTAL